MEAWREDKSVLLGEGVESSSGIGRSERCMVGVDDLDPRRLVMAFTLMVDTAMSTCQ